MKSEFCPGAPGRAAALGRKVFPFTSGALSCRIGRRMPECDEIRREGRPEAVSGYTLRLPEEESVVLSGRRQAA